MQELDLEDNFFGRGWRVVVVVLGDPQGVLYSGRHTGLTVKIWVNTSVSC